MRPSPLLFLLLLSAAAVPAELRISLCECDSPPFVEFEVKGNRPRGGLIKDIGDQVARQMGRTPRYVVLSRKRMDLALVRGDTDLNCFFNPAWTALADQLEWTEETVPQIERLLMPAEAARHVHGLDDLKGLRIGLIHGFHYPTLEPLIAAGQFTPVYERDHVSNFRLLERGAVDAVVSADLQIAHYLRGRDKGAPVAVADFVLSSTPTYCVVPKASPIDAAAVQRAVHVLREQGAFDRLLNHYRGPHLRAPARTESP